MLFISKLNPFKCSVVFFLFSEAKTQSRTEVVSSEDEFDRAEKEREQDLKERDELAKRLIKKDKEKTRSIVSKTDKKVTGFTTSDSQ